MIKQLHRRWFLLGILGLFLLAGGCSSTNPMAETQPAPGTVLFSDEFDLQTNGWKTASLDGSRVEISEGKLSLEVEKPYLDQWTVAGKSYKDVIILVVGQKELGPDDNQYGILCRYQDDSHFYAFTIGSDGYGGIWKKTQNGVEVVGGEVLEFILEAQQGDLPNTIRVDCVGDQLSLWVNGKLIRQVTDDTYISGDVGLLAGTFADGDVKILFDHFIVIQP